MPDSLVSSDWELIDPTPDALALFTQYNQRFFWGKLNSVVVTWSPRMTSCAGICCYEGRGGLCSIRLSTPLLKLRPRKDLVETLLHEMIHAYLFVTQNNRDRDGHGPEFQKHMHRINSEAKTNITIYHSFHDEVRHYKTHVWKCDGPCQRSKPYYGILKRATNRAPGPNDFWWKEHQTTCGGTYRKISEPEEFTQKQQKKQEKQDEKEKKESLRRKSLITNYLGNGKTFQESKGNSELKATNNGKKPAFTGVNKLGSAHTTSSSSGSALVRKIPGFGEIPLRVGAQSTELPQATLTLSPSSKQLHSAVHQGVCNSSTHSRDSKTATADHTPQHGNKIATPNHESLGKKTPDGKLSTAIGGSTKRLSDPSTSNTSNGMSVSAKKPRLISAGDSCHTGKNNSTTPKNAPVGSSASVFDGKIDSKVSNVSAVLKPMSSRTVVTFSDSDDDIPLLTRTSLLPDAMSGSQQKRDTQPPMSSVKLIDLSDSDDDQLNALLNKRKSNNGKRRRSTCVKSNNIDEGSSKSAVQDEPTEQLCPICAVMLPTDVLPYHVDECVLPSEDISVVPQGGGGGGTEVNNRVECPICSQAVAMHLINEHIDSMCVTHS